MKIDTSAFDEPIEQETANIDTSAFDELNTSDTTAPVATQEGPTSQEATEAKQLLSTTLGYGSGKAAQTGLEKLTEVPKIAAEKIGGLTPEQVDYYSQNYKTIEGGKGITQEGVDEGFKSLEQMFKGKNLAASQAREQAIQSIDIPFTKDLAEKAAERSFPKVLTPIDPETTTFKDILKQRTTTSIEEEATRLQSKLDELKKLQADAHEIAQNRAEKAGEEAVKKATPPKKMGLLDSPQVDKQKIYSDAFDAEIKAALPEQEKQIAALVKQRADTLNRYTDLMNEHFVQTNIEPKVKQQLIQEKQTPLAKKYETAKGFMDPEGLGQDVQKLASNYDEITEYTGPKAWEQVTAARQKAWSKDGLPAQVKDQAAKVYSEEVRNLLAPEGSAADVSFKKTNKLLNQLKEAEQQGFIGRNIGDVVSGAEGQEDYITSKFDPESVSIEKKQQDFISKVVNPSKKDLQNPDIVKARQAFDKIVGNKELTEMAKISAIRGQLIDEAKKYKVGPWDVLKATIAGLSGFNPVATTAIGGYEATRYVKTPMGAYNAATIIPKLVEKFPKTTKVAKFATKALPFAGAGIAGVAAQAAEEATSPEQSGATPQMEEYWLEKGVRNPEEQRQRALLSSFRSGLTNEGRVDKIPSPYEKPEVRQYKEKVLQAEKAGQLRPNYVEKFEATDDNQINDFLNFLQSSPDKASEEYSRVMSQLQGKSDREKSAVLFSLNQNPVFRQLAKKYKGEE